MRFRRYLGQQYVDVNNSIVVENYITNNEKKEKKKSITDFEYLFFGT
jgi:hypothetical protein